MVNTSIAYLVQLKADVGAATAKFNNAMKKVRSSGAVAGKSLDKLGKSSATLGQNISRLASRAALTIPLWLALRSVMMAVTSTIKDSMKAWVDWDTQLAKSRAVIHGFAGDTKTAMGILKSETQSLALSSGESLAELTSAFYRFGTVGLPFETAIEGMKAAQKGAMSMFIKTDEMAQILSRSYKALGNTIDSSIPEHEKMEYMMSTMYKLWQTNAFESEQFKQSLEKFLPVATQLNMKWDETVTLLATLNTANVIGGRAGRLMRQSVVKLATDLKSLASSIGISVNPNLESMEDILIRVTGALAKMDASGGIPVEAAKKVKEIFGGIRMGESIRAFTGMRSVLIENSRMLAEAREDPGKLMGSMDKQVQDVANTLQRASDRFKQAKEEAGREVITAIIGDKETQIKRLNALGTSFKSLMFSIRNTAAEWENFNLIAATTGTAAISPMIKFLKKAFDSIPDMGKWVLDREKLSMGFAPGVSKEKGEEYLDTSGKFINKSEASKRGKKAADWFNKAYSDADKKKKSAALDEKLRISEKITLEENLVLIKEQISLYQKAFETKSKLVVEEGKLNTIAKQLTTIHNESERADGKRNQQLSAHQLILLAERGEWEKILKITRDTIGNEDNMIKLAKASLSVQKQRTAELIKQDSQLRSMVFSYEEAGVLEKARIQDATRMMDYDTEELQQAHDSSEYNAKLIRDFSNIMKQTSVEGVERNLLQRYGLGARTPSGSPAPEEQTVEVESILFNSAIEALNIEVKVGGPMEEWVDAISASVKDGLLNDDTWKKSMLGYFSKNG